jgi:hypothetical protein
MPFISASIFCSSPCVNNLKVTLLPEWGRAKENSLVLRLYRVESICLSSNVDKSTKVSISSPLSLEYLNE